MNSPLTASEIASFLTSVSQAIAADQQRVDNLSKVNFSQHYDDDMWRAWRRIHIAMIESLASSAGRMTNDTLARLTDLAWSRDGQDVGGLFLELLSEAASETDPLGALPDAEHFFIALLALAGPEKADASQSHFEPREIAHWIGVTDPLRIAVDPECIYSLGVS